MFLFSPSTLAALARPFLSPNAAGDKHHPLCIARAVASRLTL